MGHAASIQGGNDESSPDHHLSIGGGTLVTSTIANNVDYANSNSNSTSNSNNSSSNSSYGGGIVFDNIHTHAQFLDLYR